MILRQDAVSNRQGPDLPDGPLITIGNFDGVHLGHRTLILKAQEAARLHGWPLVVMTFWPNSGEGVPGREVRRIYTEEQKNDLFESLVPQACMLRLTFDDGLRKMPEEEFFRHLLKERYGVKGIVVGENFRYGYGGAGNVETLKAHCAQEGMFFQAVPGVQEEESGRIISSTWIRELLEAGEMEHAGQLLGSSYYAEGEVLHGKRLGRTIGFPTVNLMLEPGLTEPRHGVYLSRIQTPDGWFYGITNLGLNPTVEHGNRIKIETHLLEHEGNLYGRHIRVEFLRYMREEHRFDSVEALKEQLQRDKEKARCLIQEFHTENGGETQL